MENTSGQGKNAVVPPEIDKWNWGAFMMNIIWGLGNGTYIILGAKGSSWAWQNKKWDSVENFQRVQRAWVKWALILLAAVLLLVIVGGMLAGKAASEG